MTPEATRISAQALLAGAEQIEATLPALREQHAETQVALEQARTNGTKDQITALEKVLKRLERVSSLRMQVVPELREEGERLLAALRAEDQTSRQHPQA